MSVHKIFMISDMHFWHENIIKYEDRPFVNAEQMTKTIIKNWNSIVQRDDEVFCLGDVCFRNKEITTEIIQRLNGIKTLILGNHDRSKSTKWWKDVGFQEVSKYPIIVDEFYILSREPVYLTESMPYANIYGHIHHLKYDSKQYYNVSVECINYTPIDFEDIKKQIIKNNI
jgi:calcineurin-like phosphoesterase family protein